MNKQLTKNENIVLLEVHVCNPDPINFVRCYIATTSGGPESDGEVLMNKLAKIPSRLTSSSPGCYKAVEDYIFLSEQPVIVRARCPGIILFETNAIIRRNGLYIAPIILNDEFYLGPNWDQIVRDKLVECEGSFIDCYLSLSVEYRYAMVILYPEEIFLIAEEDNEVLSFMEERGRSIDYWRTWKEKLV